MLTIDIVGTNFKLLATGQKEARKFPFEPEMAPKMMVAGVRKLMTDWKFEAISVDYPGSVLRNHPVTEPHNLAKGWPPFDFQGTAKRPVQIINDAAMQALGSYKRGQLRFLGLGIGLDTAMVVEGIVEPMELGHLPYQQATYEDYVGIRGLKKHGKKKWRKHGAAVVELLVAALRPDDGVLGGGNVKKLKKLPKGCRAGDNANAFVGGFRLWAKHSSSSFPAKRSRTSQRNKVLARQSES